MIEDGELLRRYVEEDSEESFTELVRRHINAVHAIAMRRSSGNTHLAADVTQKVFISLARHAPKLARHPAINGWLYTSARNAVLDLHRSDRRRLRREEEAMAMHETESTPGELSDELLLDALDQLNPQDREAVLLRFFQGCAFRQIGTTLSLTEDAARMRVDRALTKLRSVLERRGVTSTAAALSAILANNTGLGAPADLTLQVTNAALAVGPAAALTVGGVLSLLGSAKVPLGLTAAALLVLGGVVYTQGRQIGRLESSLAAIQIEHTALTARLESQREAARLAALPPPPRPAPPPDPVTALRARLDAMPDKKIPEVDLLPDGDWQSIVRVFPTIADEKQLLDVFRSVRSRGRVRFALLAVDALKRYAAENDGDLPLQTRDLAPYFEEPLSPAIFDRYTMMRTGKYADGPSSAFLIGEIDGVRDDFGDSILRIGRIPESLVVANGDGLSIRVLRASNLYAAEHQGVMPTKAEDLSAHFTAGEMAAVQARLTLEAVRAAPRIPGAPPVRVFIPPVTP